MDKKTFVQFLRTLQKDPKNWPNKFFAWEQPDKKLYMIHTASFRPFELLTYQYDIGYGDYGSHTFGIDPNVTYLYPSKKGDVKYDPIKYLATKISRYKFLGAWEDPTPFYPINDSKIQYQRWEQAKRQIPGCEKYLRK